MKGLLVFLAVVAIASAGVPVKSDKNIISDILATIQCLNDLSDSVQNQVNNILSIVGGFQDNLSNAVGALNDCTNLGDVLAIADCINTNANAIRDLVSNSILQIQIGISGLLSVPDQLGNCFNILG